ncbi:LPO_1073/Vpar_1526 family protein [Acinetobacter seifertii]|uniref:LPO_1073/Vpar_1526 family protein n=1 Tax=Acinetobacter seifertii TaxID=1530123 RepID=UPI001C0E30D2|nr:LPO_1073/Vpar_1526 family protein [Acinetobacter seifertii]MBU3084024.1 hypothetical protein [Acinetobacter seifertii]
MGHNQKQDVKNNSTAVQAEVIENLTIESGLSPKEVEIYCLGLFECNFPRLRDAAAQKAEENIKNFAENLKKNIEKNIEAIVIDKFSDPDVQFYLNDVIQNIARKGEKAHPEILIELIKNKVSKKADDFDDLICNQSVNLIDKLTTEHIQLLAFIRIVNNILPSEELMNISDMDEQKFILILKKINRGIIFFESIVNASFNLNYIQSKYLESIGLIHFDNMPFSYEAISILQEKIKENKTLGKNLKENIEKYAEKYQLFLKKYDEIFRYNFVTLSFIGEKIANSYFNSLDLYSTFEKYRNFNDLK